MEFLKRVARNGMIAGENKGHGMKKSDWRPSGGNPSAWVAPCRSEPDISPEPLGKEEK